MRNGLLLKRVIFGVQMGTLIAGNWKMHGMAPQLGEIEAIAASIEATPPSADILMCLLATLMHVRARGPRGLFAREDAVEAARATVAPVDKTQNEVRLYQRDRWGAQETDVIAADDAWDNPEARDSLSRGTKCE